MKKLTLVLMAIVLGVFLTAPAFAFGPTDGRGPGYGYGPGAGRGPGDYGNTGFNRLNLTDEQKTKIEALQTAHEKIESIYRF